MLDDRPEHQRHIGDPAASGGDGHRLSWPDLASQVQSYQLVTHRSRNVIYRGGIKPLPNAENLGVALDHTIQITPEESIWQRFERITRIPHPGR